MFFLGILLLQDYYRDFYILNQKQNQKKLQLFKRVMSLSRFSPIIQFNFFLVFPYGYYANITMGLNRTKTIPNSTDVWWEMSEQNNTYEYRPSLNCKKNQNDIFNRHFLRILSGSLSGQNYLTMMFFNDKVSPANISFLTRYG